MQSNSKNLSQLESVEAKDRQETQTCHTSKKSSDHLSLSDNASKIIAVLKRNAFVLLTLISVALGEWFSNTLHFILP